MAAVSSPVPDSGMLSLAQSILTHTSHITSTLQSSSLPEPGHTPTSSSALYDDPSLKSLTAARTALSEACLSLALLADGPLLFFRSFLGTHWDLAAMQVLLHFSVLEAIPLEGSISLQTLAGKVGLDTNRLGQLLRLTTTQRIIKEVSLGEFSHTFLSATLVKTEFLMANAKLQLLDTHPASVLAAEYYAKNPQEQRSNECPFTYKYGMPMYGYLKQTTELGARFAMAMKGVSVIDKPIAMPEKWLRDFGDTGLGFPELNTNDNAVAGQLSAGGGAEAGKAEKKLLIDVGGGSGHVSISLAKQFPDWTFQVQDIDPNMFAKTSSTLDPDLQGRISFHKHSFFEPQPSAPSPVTKKVYFMRQCLHNWADLDCLSIIRALVPALAASPKDTVLLLNETIIPERGSIPLTAERRMRQIDIAMLVIFNAKQRTESDWRALIKAADDRLEIRRVMSDGSPHGLIELGFLGETKSGATNVGVHGAAVGNGIENGVAAAAASAESNNVPNTTEAAPEDADVERPTMTPRWLSNSSNSLTAAPTSPPLAQNGEKEFRGPTVAKNGNHVAGQQAPSPLPLTGTSPPPFKPREQTTFDNANNPPTTTTLPPPLAQQQQPPPPPPSHDIHTPPDSGHGPTPGSSPFNNLSEAVQKSNTIYDNNDSKDQANNHIPTPPSTAGNDMRSKFSEEEEEVNAPGMKNGVGEVGKGNEVDGGEGDGKEGGKVGLLKRLSQKLKQ